MKRLLFSAFALSLFAAPAAAQGKKVEKPGKAAPAKKEEKKDKTKKDEAKKDDAKKDDAKKDEAKKGDAKKGDAKKGDAKKADKKKKKNADPLDALGGWKPQPVTYKKDLKGLRKFVRAMDKEMKKGAGPDAMAAHVDFPVTMITTNPEGEPQVGSMDKDAFVKAMTMSPEAGAVMAKMKKGPVKYTWVTNTMAWGQRTFRLKGKRGKRHKWESAALYVKTKDGWKIKAMAEGGWALPPPAAAAEGGASE
jgi:hypothetical protein